MKGYQVYRKDILQMLQNKIRSNGIDIPAGSWHGETRDTYTHTHIYFYWRMKVIRVAVE